MHRDTPAPRLRELVRALDTRWRTTQMLKSTVDALAISLGLSVVATLLAGLIELPISLTRLLVSVNGAAVVVGLVIAAVRRPSPFPRLLTADRAYGYHELLASGFEFSLRTSRPISDDERALRATVVKSAEDAALAVDPATVYPVTPPKTDRPRRSAGCCVGDSAHTRHERLVCLTDGNAHRGGATPGGHRATAGRTRA